MMIHLRLKTALLVLLCAGLVASCSGFRDTKIRESAFEVETGPNAGSAVDDGSSLLDIFRDGGAKVKVNRYLWNAALQTLDFLPVQSADPFTGVITTGYGRPPGGGRAYRATILISDPALDARSLNVALQTQSGPVSAGTQRAVEDAILARARQLRVQAGKF
ncbi:DUF3576 domain-containing protein [Roseovarius sp.]|uniref:DUF3576 domain-containing protein n=1 Tax=Roseovarius sp. TaxID=1486281 RepID=UPI003BA92F62